MLLSLPMINNIFLTQDDATLNPMIYNACSTITDLTHYPDFFMLSHAQQRYQVLSSANMFSKSPIN